MIISHSFPVVIKAIEDLMNFYGARVISFKVFIKFVTGLKMMVPLRFIQLQNELYCIFSSYEIKKFLLSLSTSFIFFLLRRNGLFKNSTDTFQKRE